MRHVFNLPGKARVAVVTARTEKLIQSILAKAFRGELVPNEAELG